MANPQVYKYDISLVNSVWNGRTPTGYGDSIISVEPEAAVMTPTTGVKGDVTFTWSENRNVTVSFVLMQGSDDNAYFEEAARNKVVAAFMCEDRNTGRIIVRSAQTTVSARPNYTRNAEASMNTWQIFCAIAYMQG